MQNRLVMRVQMEDSPTTSDSGTSKKRRMDLACALSRLHEIYLADLKREVSQRYSDKFLAFVGNSVVKEWPLKDFPFISEAAGNVINKEFPRINISTDILGVERCQMPSNLSKQLKQHLHYEHWTPIAFFRDTFKMRNSVIGKAEFYDLLCKYYRVVWVTKDENQRLDREKFRSYRPIDAYTQLNPPIRILHIGLWQQLYRDTPFEPSQFPLKDQGANI